MELTDVVVLLTLGAMVGATLYTRRFWLRCITATGLLGVTVFCCLAFMVLPRSVVSHRDPTRWTEDYRDGVGEAFDAIGAYIPFLLVSAGGLAVLAVIRNR
jgi:hypothetical protein